MQLKIQHDGGIQVRSHQQIIALLDLQGADRGAAGHKLVAPQASSDVRVASLILQCPLCACVCVCVSPGSHGYHG